MARTSGGRYAPMALAVVAFVVTFAAVLFYGLTRDPDPAAPRADRAIAVESPAPPPPPPEALAAEIDLLRLEVATVREEANLARAEAALARQEADLAHAGATALAEELLAAARRYEEMAARQEALEADLAEALRPPRVTVRVAEPPEPNVRVHMAEPEVTVEPSGAEAGEPRVRVEQPTQPPRVGTEPPPARPE